MRLKMPLNRVTKGLRRNQDAIKTIAGIKINNTKTFN